jgi:peptidoglycan/xylan/chitin deacetylase (PgdA/CDA1 family)
VVRAVLRRASNIAIFHSFADSHNNIVFVNGHVRYSGHRMLSDGLDSHLADSFRNLLARTNSHPPTWRYCSASSDITDSSDFISTIAGLQIVLPKRRKDFADQGDPQVRI